MKNILVIFKVFLFVTVNKTFENTVSLNIKTNKKILNNLLLCKSQLTPTIFLFY